MLKDNLIHAVTELLLPRRHLPEIQTHEIGSVQKGNILVWLGYS